MQIHNSRKGIIFDEELVMLNLDTADREDVLTRMGARLLERGYVNEDFIDAIIEREKNSPTGIAARGVGVALPHADVDYVNKASIMVGVLSKPVVFHEMVSDDEVGVSIVFMLAIKDPNQQVIMLQRLVGIIQDEPSLHRIYRAKSRSEIAAIIKDKLGDEIRTDSF